MGQKNGPTVYVGIACARDRAGCLYTPNRAPGYAAGEYWQLADRIMKEDPGPFVAWCVWVCPGPERCEPLGIWTACGDPVPGGVAIIVDGTTVGLLKQIDQLANDWRNSGLGGEVTRDEHRQD